MSKRFLIRNFENVIPEHILSRGFDYYDEGHVEDFELKDNTVSATVQ